MTRRSDYVYQVIEGVVVITDQNLGNLSVTNDAEQVIQDLVDRGIPIDALVVIYRDSMGEWDRMKTAGGRFAGFEHLGRGLDVHAAIVAAKSRARNPCKVTRSTD